MDLRAVIPGSLCAITWALTRKTRKETGEKQAAAAAAFQPLVLSSPPTAQGNQRTGGGGGVEPHLLLLALCLRLRLLSGDTHTHLPISSMVGSKGKAARAGTINGIDGGAGQQGSAAATLATLSNEERIFVDNTNAAELKLTCDEAVERVRTGYGEEGGVWKTRKRQLPAAD